LYLEARKTFLLQIKGWVYVVSNITPHVRCLTGSEISQLADSGFIEIVPHLDKPITLSLLSAKEKMYRLRRSKLTLE
jgi:hypothetical protein